MAKVSDFPIARLMEQDAEFWGRGLLVQPVGTPDHITYRVTDGVEVGFFEPNQTLEQVRGHFKGRAAQRSDAARRGAETRRRTRDATQ